MVAVECRTIFAQPDAAGMSATWDQVRDQLTPRFPNVGPLMNHAKAEVVCVQRVPPDALAQNLVDQPAGYL